MKIFMGPAGSIIKGHVLDVAEKPFERALQDYDSQLYVTWNPKKLRGHGCWEIRRRPNTKTAVYKGTHEGVDFYQLQWVEFRDIHHVLDAAFLNYDAINKLKSMDTFGDKNWVNTLEAREEAYRENIRKKANEELKYSIKQHKGLAREFREMVRSGINPAQVLTSVKWGS
jgi:hypothetical protein